MKPMPHIAITGGTGFVGRAVLQEAAARGIGVTALARQIPLQNDAATWVQGRLDDAGSLIRLVDGATVVIHIAGLTNSRDPRAFAAANIEGTAHMIAACKAANVARFVFVSSLAARKPELSAYGASKAEAEILVKQSGLNWTIIRPPGVYGPYDVDYLEMFKSAKFGFIPLPPRGASSLVHAQDLARLLLDAALGDPALCLAKILEPDDGREGGWGHDELARAIGDAVGRRVFAPHLPERLMHWGARLDGMLRGDKARLTTDRVNYMVHPNWVTSVNLRVPPALWRAAIDTREGLAQTAQWYRAQGWL